jgi:hypothetical protein
LMEQSRAVIQAAKEAIVASEPQPQPEPKTFWPTQRVRWALREDGVGRLDAVLIGGPWSGRDAIALRNALGMNSNQFAIHLGLPRNTISGWGTNPAVTLSPRNRGLLGRCLSGVDTETQLRFAAELDPEMRGSYPFHWEESGACAGTDPDIFSPGPDDTEAIHQALSICSACDPRVMRACHETTKKSDFSTIRGGTTGGERRRLSRSKSS